MANELDSAKRLSRASSAWLTRARGNEGGFLADYRDMRLMSGNTVPFWRADGNDTEEDLDNRLLAGVLRVLFPMVDEALGESVGVVVGELGSLSDRETFAGSVVQLWSGLVSPRSEGTGGIQAWSREAYFLSSSVLHKQISAVVAGNMGSYEGMECDIAELRALKDTTDKDGRISTSCVRFNGNLYYSGEQLEQVGDIISVVSAIVKRGDPGTWGVETGRVMDILRGDGRVLDYCIGRIEEEDWNDGAYARDSIGVDIMTLRYLAAVRPGSSKN